VKGLLNINGTQNDSYQINHLYTQSICTTINGTQNDSYQINHLYTQSICTTIKAGAHQLVKRLDRGIDILRTGIRLPAQSRDRLQNIQTSREDQTSLPNGYSLGWGGALSKG